jgi:glutathione synthase/RimK-type ligase-like ATP-grasp enzyme
MLIILTASDDVTSTYFAERAASVGTPLVRIDTDACTDRLRVGYTTLGGAIIEFDGHRLRASDISAVWLRRPREIRVQLDDAAESAHVANEWAEAIEGFLAHVPRERWMNHPTANVRASHKLEQLTRAAAHGLRVPKTLVTQSSAELATFWRALDGRVVVKPIASGYLEWPNGGAASIFTNRVLESHLDGALLSACPTLFQEEIAKAYDVRVTIVDDRITPVALHRTSDGQQILDIRRDNMEGVEHTRCEMPDDVRDRLMKLVRSYELRFAAVDFAVTSAGDWLFFEINPNGQWAWLDLVGATDLWRDFVDAFSS